MDRGSPSTPAAVVALPVVFVGDDDDAVVVALLFVVFVVLLVAAVVAATAAAAASAANAISFSSTHFSSLKKNAPKKKCQETNTKRKHFKLG